MSNCVSEGFSGSEDQEQFPLTFLNPQDVKYYGVHVYGEKRSFKLDDFIIFLHLSGYFGCGFPGCKEKMLVPSINEIRAHTAGHFLETKQFFCLECGVGFGRKNEASRHCRSNNKGRIHECLYCRQTFDRPDNLLRHQRDCRARRGYY